MSSDAPIITNRLGMGFIEIPAGKFKMGTADLDEDLSGILFEQLSQQTSVKDDFTIMPSSVSNHRQNS